ncbi:MAG: glycosyltransferase [Candidatus Shapirobacteria bacterium]
MTIPSKSSSLKIALVHDYLKEYGGAESVLETLSDMFPDAPIYTSLYCPSFFGPHRGRLQKKWSHRIRQSWFRFVPFANRLISPLRVISSLAFKSFDFSGFDLVITSATGAYFPNSLNKRGAKLFCYCHTPPRYLYGLPTARVWTKNPIVRTVVLFVNHFLRLLDYKYSQNVDEYIANSRTTAGRIKKYYRRESIVINPPVDIAPPIVPVHQRSSVLAFQPTSAPTYYLTGGRFARAKRFDVAIEACNKLKLPLKVFGRDFANIGADLRAMAGPTVEFVGEVTQEQKYELYRGAKAYIFCSDNEDFGIMPVEAMSQGCPVVAYGVGGATETVMDGKTGVLFPDLTATSCAQALEKLQKLKISPKNCVSRAAEFSTPIFIKKIKKLQPKKFPWPLKDTVSGLKNDIQ